MILPHFAGSRHVGSQTFDQLDRTAAAENCGRACAGFVFGHPLGATDIIEHAVLVVTDGVRHRHAAHWHGLALQRGKQRSLFAPTGARQRPRV